MNIILFEECQRVNDLTFTLNERQILHVNNVLKAKVGDTFKCGVINQYKGVARFDYIDMQAVMVFENKCFDDVVLAHFSIVLALPRIKMLKRIIHTLTQLGVSNVYLINSYRVEKSFWSSPFLQQEKLDEVCKLGLEQAGAFTMPNIYLKHKFKPFMEDELPFLFDNYRKIIAHPKADDSYDKTVEILDKPLLLAIGPEGGFIEYEVEKFEAQGFEAMQFGARILKVDTAVPFILGQLF